jgi:amino acid transporter
LAVSDEFVIAASAAYWGQNGSPETVSLVKNVLQPFPNILAMAVGSSVVLALIIALGFLANAFQITCNCFIGVTRILVAMATDGMVPRKLALQDVDPIRHAPVKAHWFYFLASILWIAAYDLIPTWSNCTLGVTFACGYVFVLSSLAATRIPTNKSMSECWKNSEIYGVSAGTIKFVGYLGFVSGGAMVLSYLVLPQLGITGFVPNMVVLGIVVIAYLIYVRARSESTFVDKALSQVPSEIEQFYSE